MATAIDKKTACAKCGFDVRENTAFCYNCGSQLRAEVDSDDAPDVSNVADATSETEVDETTRSALDDLALRLEKDAKDEEQLAKAASERRRARVALRKPKAPAWEPDEGSPASLLVLVTVVVLVLAAFIVYFTAIAK